VDTITQGRDLAALAGLLADDTRATFCMALLDGRAWTAGELARHAGVAASTASEHLTRLVAGGILVERRQGRHRYVALADARVAQMLEDLTAHLEPAGERPRTLRAVNVAAAIAGARTCYDHLAGRLGVAIADAMTRKGLIDQTGGIALTGAGEAWLRHELAIDVAALRSARRPLVRVCVDWTERRPHLAGSAGAEICRTLQERGWVRRIETSRAMLVTPTGRTALHDLLEIDTAALAASR
jgi:DNA-binding transcriptional ArsR family regulator